jgi:hypothetical protein
MSIPVLVARRIGVRLFVYNDHGEQTERGSTPKVGESL